MARLQWLAREWNCASDDFVFPCALYDIAIVAWIGLSFLMTALRRNECNSIYCCTLLDLLLSSVLPVLFLGANFLVSTALAITSSRGTLIQSSERKSVVTWMNAFMAILLIEGLYFVSRFTKLIILSSECQRSPLYSKLENGSLIFFGLPIGFIILHWKSGRGESFFANSGNSSVRILKSLLRFCFPMLVNKEQTALDKLGELMHSVFYDYGLAPSDVLAGLVLLSAHQRTQEVMKENNNSRLNSDVLTDLEDLYTHSKYFIAAYGFALLPVRCMGRALWFKLLGMPANKKSCKKESLYSLSISMHLSCSVEELIDYSSGGELYNTAFYVYLPRSSPEIVIAIRGTMCLSDCMTDILCHPTRLSLPGMNGDQEAGTVHFGMHQAARIIFERLEKNGVLYEIGNFEDRPVVILGHSLGAGVATILSIFMKSLPKFRGRVRCLAYAPPGGLLSPDLALSTSDYVKAVFYGNDVVPRLSRESVEDLRTNTVQILSHCHRNKPSVFMNWRASGRYMFGENSSFKELVSTSPKKLHPPAHIIRISPGSSAGLELFQEPIFHSIVLALRARCGKLVNMYGKNTAKEGKVLSASSPIRNNEYTARYVSIFDMEALHRIRVTPTMFTDHLPWNLQAALQSMCLE